MSNLATTTQTALAVDPYAPQDFGGAWRLAEIVVDSRLAQSINTPAAAFMVLALGQDLGLSPMQAIRGIHIIEGRPSPSADCLVACVLRSGLAEYFTEVETTEQHSTWETKRRGGQVRRYTFTMEDARRALLTERGKDPKTNNWSKYPKRMLAARAKAFLVRDVYPDLVLGLYTPEEMEDVERRPTQAAPVQVHVEQVADTTQVATDTAYDAWELSLATAKSVDELRRAANVAVKRHGIPADQVKPLFSKRLAELEPPPPVEEPVGAELVAEAAPVTEAAE